MLWQVAPCGLGNFPNLRPRYLPIHHLAQKADPLVGADGDKIEPGLMVIVPLQAIGLALVFFWIKFQTNPLRKKNTT